MFLKSISQIKEVMDAARLKRYNDKLNLISRRRNQAAEWLERFAEGEMPVLACYKAFQEIAEAAMDVLSMVVRDCNEVPKDDYTNISLALREGVISSEIAEALRKANGLRNRLVHEYNGLDTAIAHESMSGLLEIFDAFCEKVTAWLEKKRS